MIYEDKKEIEYVAKWIRIPIMIFIKCLTNITNGLIIEVNNVEKKFKVKIERMQDIKGLI